MRIEAYRRNPSSGAAPKVQDSGSKFYVDIAVDLGGGRLEWGAARLGPYSQSTAHAQAKKHGRCARVITR